MQIYLPVVEVNIPVQGWLVGGLVGQAGLGETVPACRYAASSA